MVVGMSNAIYSLSNSISRTNHIHILWLNVMLLLRNTIIVTQVVINQPQINEFIINGCNNNHYQIPKNPMAVHLLPILTNNLQYCDKI